MRELSELDRYVASRSNTVHIPDDRNDPPQTIGIEAGWQNYIDGHSGPPHLGGLANSSIRKYQAHRKKFAKFCSEHDLDCWTAVSKSILQQYGRWLTDVEKLAPRTIHNDLVMQISVSNWLIAEKMIPGACKIGWNLKKPPGAQQYCFRREQVNRMLKFTGNDEQLLWLHSVIMVLSHTGMRISEAINLQWSDIDLDIGVIRVRDERYEKTASPKRRLVKDGDSRNIPVPTTLGQYLRQQQRRRGFVLRGPKGGQLNYNSARELFISIVIEPLCPEFCATGIDNGFEHARFHSFRHFFVSECFAAGCPESDIRDWLGHSSTQIVELYRHQRHDVARKNISRVDFGADR